MINLHIGVKSFHKYESVRPSDGRRTLLTDWIPNSVLTSGRNVMADDSTWFNFSVVGTAGTPIPSPSDTGLSGYWAGSSLINDGSDVWGATSSAPYYIWRRKTWRYLPGTVATPLSEGGVGWSISNGDQIVRALITDIDGVPTTVTPLADEYLDKTVELRYYPPLTPVNAQVTLNGEVFDTITTASQVTSAGLGIYIGTAMRVLSGSVGYWKVYTGEPGTIEQAPDGTSANCDISTFTTAPYQNNSYEVDMIANCGPTGWNVGGDGFRSMHVQTSAGNFQTRFGADGNGALTLDDPVPKTNQFTIGFGYTMSWDEQIIP